MVEEQKQILLKDLCSRIPYDTVVNVKGSGDVYLDGVNWYEEVTVRDYTTNTYPIEDVKPYLRPMSSMTKEEAIEMYFTVDDNADDSRNVINCEVGKDKISFLLEHNGNYVGHRVLFFNTIYSLGQMDWLNSKHYDYRGLIPMGIALEAPEGMYN